MQAFQSNDFEIPCTDTGNWIKTNPKIHETDRSIHTHIQDLVAEEQKLYQGGDLSDHDQVRLKDISVELDQYWDLLRQRQALREFGNDPDKARIRPAKVVENYEQ